jgi:hypothetical protein
MLMKNNKYIYGTYKTIGRRDRKRPRQQQKKTTCNATCKKVVKERIRRKRIVVYT